MDARINRYFPCQPNRLADPKIRLRVQLIAACVTAPIWASLLVLIWWWAIDYQSWNPLGGPVVSQRGEVLTPVIRAGGLAKVRYQWRVLRDCRRDIEWWFVDGFAHQLQSSRGSTAGLDQRKQVSRVVVFAVPELVEPGPASIVMTIEAWCNPLQPWRWAHALPITVIQ